MTTSIPRRAILAMVALCVGRLRGRARPDHGPYGHAVDHASRSTSTYGTSTTPAGSSPPYLLGYTVAMPLFGRLADVKGTTAHGHGGTGAVPGGKRTLRAISTGSASSWPPAWSRRPAAGRWCPSPWPRRPTCSRRAGRALVLGIVGGAAEAGGVLGPLYGAGSMRSGTGGSSSWSTSPCA